MILAMKAILYVQAQCSPALPARSLNQTEPEIDATNQEPGDESLIPLPKYAG